MCDPWLVVRIRLRWERVAWRVTEADTRGEQVFLSNCNGCHPGGGAGIGPARNNRPIPESLVRSQVRNGRGIMPAFPGTASRMNSSMNSSRTSRPCASRTRGNRTGHLHT